MTSKTASLSQTSPEAKVRRLVNLMTVVAWVVLGIGVLLCLFNLNQFNDQNRALMVGIGFLVGSVFIFVIGTAIGMVSARRHEEETQ
ncbi:hypothetical protein D3C73_655840 [compost metagenome]